MSTVADASSAKSALYSAAGLMIELEGVALPVRSALFDIAREVLAERSIQLDRAVFAKCAGSIPAFASQLAEALSLEMGADAFANALYDALTSKLQSGAMPAHAGIARLVEAALKRGIVTAALSGLPPALANAAFSAAGFQTPQVHLITFPEEDKSFPRVDAWLKAAKQLNKHIRACVAVGSSQMAVKTALSAGMRVIAVPDEFTMFHDFGGADVIVESWADTDAEALLEDALPVVR